MNVVKLLIGSLIASVALVTVFRFLPDSFAFLSQPGLVIEVMLIGFLLLLVPSGDNYPQLPIGTDAAINVVFYFVLIFLFLLLLKVMKRSRR
jgi:hypothetical protein